MPNGDSELTCQMTFLKGGPLPPLLKQIPVCLLEPTTPGFIKINFDGSLTHSIAASGYILRDWTGKVLKLGAANYGQSFVLVAEARALRDGVRVASQAGFTSLCIEGDNHTVIQALQGTISVPWKISTILEDVRTWPQ